MRFPHRHHSSFSSSSCEAELIAQLKNRLQWAELKIQLLEERLRLVRIAKYGPSSEKLSDAQLELLEAELGVSNVEVQAESQREAALPSTQPNNKKKRKHPGRQELPAHPPRVERILTCTPEQCLCQGCGKENVEIGYEESTQLDVEPAKYFRAGDEAREGGLQVVRTAPLPPRIIEKSLASDRIVIDTIVSKYCDHAPLYRQSAIPERDTGLELSRATLDGLGTESGRVADPDGLGHAARATRWQLYPGR